MSRRRHEEEENQERWLLTYADMITLLVAFFMMMYSMSVLNMEKFKQAAIGIRSGFNGPVLNGKTDGESVIEKGVPEKLSPPVVLPVVPINAKLGEPEKSAPGRARPGKPSPAAQRAERVRELTERINQSLTGIASGKVAKVSAESKGVAIELIGDTIFFPSGSAQLSEEAQRVLRAVTGVLADLPNEISVEGHTSRFVPDGAADFANSWELSTARGTSVVKFLLEIGRINPQRVSVTGYGHYRPAQAGSQASQDLVRVFIYQD